MLFASVIILSWLMTTCGIFIFLTLSNTGAVVGYGRYSKPGGSKTLPANLAWAIQQSPAFFIPAYFYWTRTEKCSGFGQVLTILMMIHYGYRAFFYPCLLKTAHRTPVRIVAVSFVFSAWNGFIQGAWNTNFQPEFEDFYPKFLVLFGIFLFYAGFILHVISDLYLISLRYTPTVTYRMPGFSLISCPNYLGECVQWIGFAVAARSFPAIAFAFFTVCNLAPRAMSHHKWYKERFGDKYPEDRKALIPFYW